MAEDPRQNARRLVSFAQEAADRIERRALEIEDPDARGRLFKRAAEIRNLRSEV